MGSRSLDSSRNPLWWRKPGQDAGKNPTSTLSVVRQRNVPVVGTNLFDKFPEQVSDPLLMMIGDQGRVANGQSPISRQLLQSIV
jgi:hypothetical protein